MKKQYIISALCLALMSCESYGEYEKRTTAPAYKLSIAAMTDAEVLEECRPYATHKDIVLDEIVERDLMSLKSLVHVVSEKIYVGMSEEAVKCSLGRPASINTTASVGGIRYQWVYECPHSSGGISYTLPCKYLHIENGVVTSYRVLDD
ncbi:MAG: hypothetical protein ACR2OT_05585 [Parvibaculales bacterium]